MMNKMTFAAAQPMVGISFSTETKPSQFFSSGKAIFTLKGRRSRMLLHPTQHARTRLYLTFSTTAKTPDATRSAMAGIGFGVY